MPCFTLALHTVKPMQENQLYIASDHAGFELKTQLLVSLKAANRSIQDLGAYSSESVDYPDFVHKLAEQMKSSSESMGILICGSGNGVCITANRYPHIRAALAWKSELAELARAHNNANVLCLPARFISVNEAENAVSKFLNTSFEGGRHATRVDKINPKL